MRFHNKSYILLKSEFFGLYFCHIYGSNFNHCNIIGPKANKFDEVMQSNSHYAVWCYKRLSSLVPVESPCVIFCVLVIVMYLLSCTVFERT